MGDILTKLGLTPSRRMLEAQRAAAGGDIEVVEDGGADWDDREVGEAEIAAFLAGGDGEPKAPAGPAAKPAEAAPAGGPSITVPVSLSIKVERQFKYAQVEKVKVEGELKIAPADDGGGIVKSSDVLGVSLDKGKLSPAKKFEVDLKKLAALVLGDIESVGQDSKVQVDPKLEFKIGPDEVNVALGVSVACGWYIGSTKLVAVAKEKGKDLQFADVQVSPIGYQIQPRYVDFNGVKGKVSGKLTVALVLKPAWGTIAADVAQKVGRSVLTTIAEALTAEAAIAAGFVAAGAAQVFAYVKSVTEWQDVKACAAAAERGWLSFRAGFGAVYGLRWNDGGVAALRRAGADAATQFQQARLKATRERVRSEQGSLPAGFDADYLVALKEQVAKNPDAFGLWVEGNFRRGIVDGFLRAYQSEHHDDTQFKPNFRALRTLLGAR